MAEEQSSLLSFFAAGHRAEEKKRKKERKEAEKIDWKQVFAKYFVGQSAALLSETAMSPIIAGTKSLSKEFLVDPYTQKIANTLVEPNPTSVRNTDTTNTEMFTNLNKRINYGATTHGQSHSQTTEEALIDQAVPIIKQRYIDQNPDDMNISQINDKSWKALGRRFVNEPRYYYDRDGNLVDKDVHDKPRGPGFDTTSWSQLVKEKKLIGKSILEKRVEAEKDFLAAVQGVPKGARDLFAQRVVTAGMAGNTLGHIGIVLRDSISNKDINLKDQLAFVMDERISQGYTKFLQQPEVFEFVNNPNPTEKSFNEMNPENQAKYLDYAKTINQLTPSMRALHSTALRLNDITEKREYLSSNNVRVMLGEALQEQDIVNLIKKTSTDTVMKEKRGAVQNDDGTYSYITTTTKSRTHAGKLEEEQVSKKEVFKFTDDASFETYAISLQENAKFNLFNIGKAILSEDGLKVLKSGINKDFEQGGELQEFFTDGTGNRLNLNSPHLNMEQYNWMLNRISEISFEDNGVYSKDRSLRKSEEYLEFKKYFLKTWADLREAGKAFGETKEYLTHGVGNAKIIYADDWMFLDGDRSKKFDAKKYMDPKTSEPIKAAIPEGKLKSDNWSEKQILDQMRRLYRAQGASVQALAAFDEAYEVTQALNERFNIVDYGLGDLSATDKVVPGRATTVRAAPDVAYPNVTPRSLLNRTEPRLFP